MTLEFEFIDHQGHDIFKDRDHGGHRRRAHEQEEGHAPPAAAPHLGKNIRQSYENQRWAGTGVDAERETGRENHQPRQQRHRCVQPDDPQRFSGQRVLLADVASEHRHGPDAEAQGEKRLSHGGGNHFAEFRRRYRAWIEKESYALRRAGKRHGMADQQHQQYEQGAHQYFGYAFNAPPQAQHSHRGAQRHRNQHIFGKPPGR
ncbi:hypothetical protein SDC9_182234 [bioreactor metagenome]|uniref:Uncharacterized protein n=1 Tax=bioreactor metagenome TaxID=1076179 RepID=A0A645H7T3_9ZZZZ